VPNGQLASKDISVPNSQLVRRYFSTKRSVSKDISVQNIQPVGGVSVQNVQPAGDISIQNVESVGDISVQNMIQRINTEG
jgi:hypothetical protein